VSTRSSILLALFLSVFSLYGIQPPNEPKEPDFTAPDPAPDQGEEAPKNTTAVVTNTITSGKPADWRVRVFFIDGRMLEGVTSLGYSEYVVDFVENGNKFYKKLSLSETASIRVNRWKAVHSESEEERELYFFMPELYRVITRSGEVYRLYKRMKMLDTIDLATQRGNTRVYSYFADYWLGTEDKGQWENSGSEEFDYNDTHPNPQTVYRIDFISEH